MEESMSDLIVGSKIPESTARIRFPDCDPFGHLNNSRYIDYFINAREDQLRDHYGLDIYENREFSWVVGQQQIVYLKPANLMETVTIQTQTIAFGSRYVQVEMRMYNRDKSALKSLLWARFVHFNIRKQKSAEHSDEYMSFFEKIVEPVPEENFEKRVESLRMKQQPNTV
jgi:YbgC/YbaW family acyl-CoA thioester hydrolase